MSAKSLFFPKNHVETTEFKMADQRERLIYNVTEDLLVLMEDKGINKAELAKRVGTTKSNISQLLNGARNMTLGKLSDICFALGVTPKVIIPVGYQSTDWPVSATMPTKVITRPESPYQRERFVTVG